MEGSPSHELRVGPPSAVYVLLSAGLVLMALAAANAISVVLAASCWVLVIGGLSWLGRRVFTTDSVRAAWRTVAWRDIDNGRCRWGFIELRTATRPFSLPDTARMRAAVLASAPVDHPVRTTLATRGRPRVNVLDVIAALMFLVALAGVVSVARMWTDNQRRVREIDRTYAAHVDEFLRDARLASALDVFRPPFQGTDAAPFLNSHVRWRPPRPSGPKSDAGVPWFIRVPDSCTRSLDDACLEQVDFDDACLEQVDLSWMADVSKYTHWDLFTAGPASAALARLAPDDFVGAASLLEPVWGELVFAARVRLAKAQRDQQLRQGISEVRRLARLAYSTETFSGAMTALRILTAETRLRAKLAQPAEDGATPAAVPEQTLVAARRTILAYEAFFSPLAPRPMRAQIFGDAELNFGRCQGMGAGARSSVIVRRILETPLLFARDYRTDYATMGDILDAKRAECRLTDVRRRWALSGAPAPLLMPVVRLSRAWIAAPSFGLEIAYGRKGRPVSAR